MPLYIDFHKLSFNPSEEEVREAHQLDLDVQEEYGIKFQQFWFNKKEATIFCLIEAPGPEVIKHCHWAGAGDTPCNIQEVEPLYLRLFMGEAGSLKHDMTMTIDGKVDPANRTLLLIMIDHASSPEGTAVSIHLGNTFHRLKEIIIDIFSRFKGRFVEQSKEDNLVGVFDSPTNALKCVEVLNDHFQRFQTELGDELAIKMALHSGLPLTKEGGFFEHAIKQTERLCMISPDRQITVSAKLTNLIETETELILNSSSQRKIKVLNEAEERFIHSLYDLIEQNITNQSFNVNKLSEIMGLSRPQLYRKTISVSGKSPNEFITALRMQRAFELLKNKKGNVSEVALEVGYANPSYFSKVFQDSFGYTPSSLHVG